VKEEFIRGLFNISSTEIGYQDRQDEATFVEYGVE